MAKVDKLPTRIFLMVIVVLFVVTTVASAAYVIYLAQKENNDAANLASTSTSTSTETGGNNVDQSTNNSGQLKGNPLANFTPITSPVTELQKTDTVTGTGEEAKAESTVTVDYTGALASTGVVFESSLDSGQTATFPLSGVIEGWREGVPGMKVGGTRRLVIPAEQAYGPSGAGDSIPPNSDLVFDIVLKDVQ